MDMTKAITTVAAAVSSPNGEFTAGQEYQVTEHEAGSKSATVLDNTNTPRRIRIGHPCPWMVGEVWQIVAYEGDG